MLDSLRLWVVLYVLFKVLSLFVGGGCMCCSVNWVFLVVSLVIFDDKVNLKVSLNFYL